MSLLYTSNIIFILVHYQVEMLRYLRHINVDYLQVGFYVSTYLGSFINRVTVESQFNYQQVIEESVFLIYGKNLNLLYYFAEIS